MKRLGCAVAAIFISMLCMGLACPTIEPPLPPRLSSPIIDSITLTGYNKILNVHRETLKLNWSPPLNQYTSVASYTLLRKTARDSLFDIFDMSRSIDMLEFHDDLNVIGFPSSFYDSISYRIFAVDSLGRSGDTSHIFSIMLAVQPSFKEFNQTSWTFKWTVLGILGAMTSHIKIWNKDQSRIWSSTPQIQYPGENQILTFSVSLPQNLIPLQPGDWYYGIFVEANGAERQSLKVGSIKIQ